MTSGHSNLMPHRIVMTTSRVLRLFVISAILISFTTCRSREYPYTISTFKLEHGWGYDILVKEKVYIHQPYMPAIDGEVPFKSKNAAEKTAKLVVKKLKHHKVPSVSREELQKIIRE